MAHSLQIRSTEPDIVDVREQQDSESISTAISALRTQILAGLYKPPHSRTLPTLLLYDERGLLIYEQLTLHAPEYYLFPAEEQILADHAPDIVRAAKADSGEGVLVELGAGSLRKTSHILLALAAAHEARDKAPITYYALDLERRELVRTLNVVKETIGSQLAGKVDTKGMWGTYDGGLAFIRSGGLVDGSANDDDELTTETGKPPYSPITPAKYAPPSSRVSFDQVRPSSPTPSDDGRTVSTDLPSSEQGTQYSTQTPITSQSTDRHTMSARFDEAATHPPLHFLFLGTTLGNFHRPDAAEFLKGIPLRPGSGDTFLLGLDKRNSKEEVELAYDDPHGYTNAFAMNGLRVAERILKGRGDDVDMEVGDIFKKDGWEYYARYNEVEGRHEAYYRSTQGQVVVIPPDIDRPKDPETPVHFEKGELINHEYSYKYSTSEALALFAAAGLRVVNRWTDKTGRYLVWLLERPAFNFSLRPPILAVPYSPLVSRSMPLEYPEPFPAVPTLAEWTALWSLWDNITTSMIPPNMLHVAPIDLRHRCLFYFGHIPTFLDIHLTRILRKIGNKREEEGHTGPVYFKDLFERGIDPSVDDPSQIHPHSEVPTKDEDWPSLETVLGFRDRVRARLIRVYEEYGVANKESLDPTVRDFDRQLARVLWMTWEHEAMHAETLLYMLIQKAGEPGGTLPPKGFLPPAWDVLQKKAGWSADVTAAPTVTIEPTTVFLGHDDIEADDSTAKMEQRYEFGWDSENPKREAQITSPIRIETRPVLNGEFCAYWKGVGEDSLPAQWTKDDEGNIMVRTLYGPVPLSVAKNWPFIGSYDELQAYATSKGGRLPSEPELRHYIDVYGDSDESNVGFKNWHPIPPKLPESGQRGHNGGVWEWTSTIWDSHEGFQKSILYPGFSSDFFDGQHHAVLGASYATVPRIAQRRSFRNWYQHNYRYAWIGGRVVYDI